MADDRMGSRHTGMDERESGCCRGCATWFKVQGIGRLDGDTRVEAAWAVRARAGDGALSERAST